MTKPIRPILSVNGWLIELVPNISEMDGSVCGSVEVAVLEDGRLHNFSEHVYFKMTLDPARTYPEFDLRTKAMAIGSYVRQALKDAGMDNRIPTKVHFHTTKIGMYVIYATTITLVEPVKADAVGQSHDIDSSE